MTFGFACITMTRVPFPPHINPLMKKPFTFVCAYNALKTFPARILHWVVVRNVVQVTFCMTDSHCHWIIVFSVLLQVRLVEHWIARFAHSVPALPPALGGSMCIPTALVCSRFKHWVTQCNGHPSSPNVTLSEFTASFFTFFPISAIFHIAIHSGQIILASQMHWHLKLLISFQENLFLPTSINTFY